MNSRTKTLDEIALETGTDKASSGHGYTHTYDLLFSAWRHAPITLVEIGVWEGASLRMWREYFTNDEARIIGVDINISFSRFHSGVELLQRDAAIQARDVAEWVGAADIVIDDASHIAAEQTATFAALWPRVRPGGLYAIEDLHTYWIPHANPGGSEHWLVELMRDCWGRGVDLADRNKERPPKSNIGSVMVFPSLIVIEKTNDV